MGKLTGYKKTFVDLLLKTGAFKVGGPWKTKTTSRESPYFINMGLINSGSNLKKLGKSYAGSITYGNQNPSFDYIYGIPYKGISIATATSISLSDSGIEIPWFSTRKETKDYGEFSDRGSFLLGVENVEPGATIRLQDDVMSTGRTKLDEIKKLKTILERPNFSVLDIGVDRQEMNEYNKNTIYEFTKETGIEVKPIVKTLEIYNYVKDMSKNDLSNLGVTINMEDLEKIPEYLRKYGIEDVRTALESFEPKKKK